MASASESSVGLGVNSVGDSKSAANPEAVAAIKPAAARASISIQTEAAAKSVRGGAQEQQLLDMLLARGLEASLVRMPAHRIYRIRDHTGHQRVRRFQ